MTLLIALLVLECAAMIAAGIRFPIKYYRLLKQGRKIEQKKLSGLGLLMALIGSFVMVGLTRMVVVRGDFTVQGLFLYLLMTLIGACGLIVITGLGFILSAYKTEEDTPNWIRWIMNLWH